MLEMELNLNILQLFFLVYIAKSYISDCNNDDYLMQM